ncbi:uncharacterized protein G2W53_008083 [Senna tora]|uniref:Uncharacterized protein n=1 Tax=Senna tora TaxID=362788 RepID=A0A834X781_9FABA|nr:uncharacterized protein G2W53_008083 [Senna tora]
MTHNVRISIRRLYANERAKVGPKK